MLGAWSPGLFLAPPQQALATAPPGTRPGSEQVPVVSLGQMGRPVGNGVSPVGPTIEPMGRWPVHMGGVDINHLRLHDQHL